MSEASGSPRFAGYIVRNVAAVGAIAVRLAITATAVVPDPIAGIPPCPAATMRRTPFAPNAPPVHPGPADRVSQIRVGWIPWYWAPAAAEVLPNHPPASMITLIAPAALYTQSELAGPPVVDGPSATMTRFAATRPAGRLIVENFGAVLPLYGHWPFEFVGESVRYVPVVPATPVRLTTAAAAVPFPGMASEPVPVTLTSSAPPAPIAPCCLQSGVGEPLLVSHTRTGEIGWNSPATTLDDVGSKYPSTSARALTVPSAL